MMERHKRKTVLHDAMATFWDDSAEAWALFQQEQTLAYQNWKRREAAAWRELSATVGPVIGFEMFAKPEDGPAELVSNAGSE